MNLIQDLEELLSMEDQNVLVLSVYLDTSVGREGQRTYPVFLKKRTNILAKMQEHKSGDEGTSEFLDNIRRIESYLFDELRKDTRGVAVFSSTGRDYFKAIQLPVPVRNKVAVSTSPNLDILIELVEENRHYCVVTIDQHSGRIFSVFLSDILGSQQLSDEVPGRSRVGGWSQMRFQRHRLDLIQHFMRDLGTQLERFVRKTRPHSIVLLGTPSNLSEFRKHLSPEIGRRILFTRNIPSHSDDKDLIEQVQADIRKQESLAEDQAINQLYERLCQDYMAVVGLDETLFNLQMGRLERLFVSNHLSGRGYRCTHCDFVFGQLMPRCLYCQSPVEEVELRNRMEKLAEHHDVLIDVVSTSSFLDSLGGVGGFLRY